MVFSSTPIYLDPPNWHQQPNQQSGDAGENFQLPPLPAQTSGGSSGGSIRPSSMSERARLAKIAQPKTALKCPRCDSTNTKFCYFNNYSLTQPRHFCKTCRRYWTRGGALRSVPVGGGCRHNKRTKGSNRSKSPSKAGSSSSTGLISSNAHSTNDILGHNMLPPQLPILPPLHQLSDFSSAGVGLNYGGIQPPGTATGSGVMDFQIGGTNSGGNFMPNGLADHLRFQQVQQFPYLANLGPGNGLYFNEGEGVRTPNYVGQLRSKPLDIATVKMEEDHRQLGSKLPKHMFGNESNDQYWSGNAQFTDLSGFTSSSSSHLL